MSDNLNTQVCTQWSIFPGMSSTNTFTRCERERYSWSQIFKNLLSISTDIVYTAVSAVKLCVTCQSSKQHVKLTVSEHERSTPTQTLYGHCTGQLVLADTPS